jgi:hypothetical protein
MPHTLNHRRLRWDPVDRNGPAVDPAQKTLLLKLAQIAPNGHLAYTKPIAQPGNRDLPVLLEGLEDLLLSIVFQSHTGTHPNS